MSMTRAEKILDGRILGLELEPLGRIERREVVEVDLVLRRLGVLEVDLRDLEESEVALAFLGRADLAFDGVARAQREAADLGGRDVDVVGSRQIVGVGRAQEAEAILQHLDDAGAGNFDLFGGELLERGEHQLLLAHGAGVLDARLLREAQELRGRLELEVFELHFLHGMLRWPRRWGGRRGAGPGRWWEISGSRGRMPRRGLPCPSTETVWGCGDQPIGLSGPEFDAELRSI